MRDLDPPIGKSRGEYKAMKCPQCQGKSRVINVQDVGEAGEVRYRRHVCDECKGRFTTYEITAEQFERLQRVKLSEDKIDNAIAALSMVKAQFNGARNGPSSKN